MTDSISNTDELIDSRDVIKRIAELEALIEADDGGTLDDDADVAGEDERAELAALKALTEAASGCADWQNGETLISESYFQEYAEQLAEDIGAISSDGGWPACHIDWSAAADALKADYKSVDFNGETYWIRS